MKTLPHAGLPLLASLLLVACPGKTPLPVAPDDTAPPAPTAQPTIVSAPSASASTSAALPAPPCPDARGCYGAAKKAREADDMPKAKELYGLACEQGHAEACNELGVLSEESDAARSLELKVQACDLGSLFGCANAGEGLSDSEPRRALIYYRKACAPATEARVRAVACLHGGITAYGADDFDTAFEMSSTVCNDELADGCNLLGVLYLQGKGVAADEARGKKLVHRACAAGNEEACSNEKRLGTGDLDVPGANITLGSVSADGFTMTDMACKSAGGGLESLFLGPAVAGSLSKKKGALDACAPQGADVRIRWSSSAGRVTSAEAKAPDPKIEACVVKVLKSAPGVLDGTCAASVHLGR